MYTAICTDYMYNCDFFSFGNTSLCWHLYPESRREWAQFDRGGHVAGGLGAIRAVCRPWQAFKLFWSRAHLNKISGFPHPRVSATSPGIGFLHPLYPRTHVRFGCKTGFSARRGSTFVSFFWHRAPRYDPAAQQQSSSLAAAACNFMRVWLLL